ncbi:MAG: hypothetical protein D6679_05960 [Candidatus Hydrogenedentota bacterium]|nr:MAG: hypothetical protein D6679_05960 [Candidatus Hydrogenedentota bacterium]
MTPRADRQFADWRVYAPNLPFPFAFAFFLFTFAFFFFPCLPWSIPFGVFRGSAAGKQKKAASSPKHPEKEGGQEGGKSLFEFNSFPSIGLLLKCESDRRGRNPLENPFLRFGTLNHQINEKKVKKVMM